MDTSNFSGLILIISIAYIILSIFIIIAFFKMAEDIKVIKEKTVKNTAIIKDKIVTKPKVKDQSIFKLLEGKKEEAIAEIKRSFIIECTLILEKYNYAYDYDADAEANNLIGEYIYRYKTSLKDEITLEYLTDIYKSIKKLFYSEPTPDGL